MLAVGCGPKVEPTTGQSYCFAYGEALNDIIDQTCGLVLTSDGDFVQTRPDLLKENHINIHQPDYMYASNYFAQGGKLYYRDWLESGGMQDKAGARAFKISEEDDQYKVTLQDEDGYTRHLWFWPMREANVELVESYMAYEMPEVSIEETSLINKPVCMWKEGWVEEARPELKYPSSKTCGERDILFLHEDGYLIDIDLSSFRKSNGYQWRLQGFWDESKGAPLPVTFETHLWPKNYRDFEWSTGDDGAIVSDIRETPHRIVNADGMKFLSRMTLEPYTGDRQEEVTQIYAEHIYPRTKKLGLLTNIDSKEFLLK